MDDLGAFAGWDPLLLQVAREPPHVDLERSVPVDDLPLGEREAVGRDLLLLDHCGQVAAGHELPAGRHVQRGMIGCDAERLLHAPVFGGGAAQCDQERRRRAVLRCRRQRQRHERFERREDLFEEHHGLAGEARVGCAAHGEPAAGIPPGLVSIVTDERHRRLGRMLPAAAVAKLVHPFGQQGMFRRRERLDCRDPRRADRRPGDQLHNPARWLDDLHETDRGCRVAVFAGGCGFDDEPLQPSAVVKPEALELPRAGGESGAWLSDDNAAR